MSMRQLINYLGYIIERPIVDQTGLAEHYNYTLKVIEGPTETQLREALPTLGLNLVEQMAKVEFLVVDEIELPLEITPPHKKI